MHACRNCYYLSQKHNNTEPYSLSQDTLYTHPPVVVSCGLMLKPWIGNREILWDLNLYLIAFLDQGLHQGFPLWTQLGYLTSLSQFPPLKGGDCLPAYQYYSELLSETEFFSLECLLHHPFNIPASTGSFLKVHFLVFCVVQF